LPARKDTSLRPFATLSLIRGFELWVGTPLRVPLNAQRLVAFLALQRRPLHRAYVAGRLWLDLSQDHAFGCLRTTLWRLGRLPCDVVDATSTHLALRPTIAVDVHELEASAARAFSSESPLRRTDLECLARHGELLPDWYDDWVLEERERLRQVRLLALEAACNGLIGAGLHAEAARAALAAVASDPLRESSYRLLIRAYLGEGNVAEALRQFAVFRAEMERAFGLAPSGHMEQLVRGLVA
jgi:DNA-binding SARP family transcriptional activator